MRSITAILVSFMFAALTLVQGQGAFPIYQGPQYASITFSSGTDQPVLSGPPTAIDTVMLYYTGTGITSSISLAEIRGDSLIITVGMTGVLNTAGSANSLAPFVIFPSGYPVVFNQIGVYHAYELLPTLGPLPSYRDMGSFRILPKIIRTPNPLLANDSARIQLLIGQEMMLCFHTYHTTARVIDSLIFLSFIADTDYACSRIAVQGPIPFGPSYNLGLLSAGSYQLLLPIPGDTGNYIAGSITVYDPIIVNGTVFPMMNPLTGMVSIPIQDAKVFAVPAPTCEWGFPSLTADTVWSQSDALGNFSLSVANTGVDYEISALAQGYRGQSMYLNSYPMLETYPPQVDLSFELIRDTDSAVGGCVIQVNSPSGEPVESAYVSLSAGREMLICPMLMAKALIGIGDFSGYTGSDGKFTVSGASLEPFIDYKVNIAKGALAASDLIRLNRFLVSDFTFTLDVVGVEKAGKARAGVTLSASPNPFNPAVTISFSNPGKTADLSIYNMEGKLIQSFRRAAGPSVTWNADGFPSGLYILKADLGNRILTRKLILSK